MSGSGPAAPSGARAFNASAGRTAALIAAMLFVALIAGGLARAYWEAWIVSGVLLSVVIGLSIVVAILAMRLVGRPVMLRVDEAGIWLKRLQLTLPWEALQRVDLVNVHGKTCVALVEREGGHPVFRSRAVLLGAALNEQAGLPALAISMDAYQGSVEELAEAIRAVGRVPVEDRREQAPLAGAR